jgi:oligoendopeptidase F
MKYKTTWNLGLLYKNEKDEQIEKDLKKIENLCAVFEKKYKKSDYISSVSKIAKALEDYEILNKKIEGSKPLWYFALRTKLNSSDEIATAFETKFSQRITNAANKVTFFNLNIAKIDKKNQKIFLANKKLKPYKYFLEKIFEHAKFNLSEGEEQIIDLLSETSFSMWVNGGQKLLGEQTIEYKGEKIPFTKASSMFSDLPKNERREIYSKMNEVSKSVAHFAEAEINAVYNYKKILDERRGYGKPYSSTVLAYENDEKTIEMLVNLVTEYFSISKRFYKLHAKLLKEEKITYADRSVTIGKIKKNFDFDASVSIVRDVFNKIDKKYGDILDNFLENGQIDVYPKKGKSGGAFCWGNGDLQTFVLLNHTDNINSVETLAHEMGHAIHTELSKSQSVFYKDYTMSVAEVASTFFEQVVSEELESHLSKEEQIIFLHNKIKGDVQTIFRQIACFNFELELHQKIREKGQLAKKDIAILMNKHMKAYLGDAVDLKEDDGYFFVQWSHIRNFFYVYSYAYGQIISRALFENWKKDKSYSKKIEQFLSSGSSMSPEDIFKKIGIDTSSKTFFETGLKSVENDIKRLEKLAP